MSEAACADIYYIENQWFSHVSSLIFHFVFFFSICPVFVGEVTGIRSVEFGIYSLDNDNTLLFCTYLLSGPDISGGLRVGATVIVQNAHACKVIQGTIQG